MKKSNFLIFLLIIFIIGGGAFALSGRYLKSNGTPNFQALKSTANNNQLNAEMRDQLMDGLSRMQAQGLGSVPEGAVMAFDLPRCPEGWIRFSNADNRFIMGSQTNSKETGGSGAYMMKPEQVAPHSHWFVDTIWSERGGHGARNGVDDKAKGTWAGMRGRTDDDNSLYLVWRKTGSKIARGDLNTKCGDDGICSDSRARGRFGNDEKEVDQGLTQQPLNVLNPYIKLLYCKKI